MYFSDGSEHLTGVLIRIGIYFLPKDNAANAVEICDTTVLLGVGGMAYNWQITQYEALLNSHYQQKQKLIVDGAVRTIGGTQLITISQNPRVNLTLPLDFGWDWNTMKFDVCEPTTEGLMNLETR